MAKEKILKLFNDAKWFPQFHKAWFWGNFGDRLVVWQDGKMSYLPQNTNLHPEDWKKVLFVYPCPGWNNIDTSLYEEGVGVYNEEEGKWEWDPDFAEIYPEIIRKYGFSPSWQDIINASIEAGEWDYFKEEILKIILDD